MLGPPEGALLIDCGSAGMAPGIIETLAANGLKPDGIRAIVISHGHSDHYGGASDLVAWCGAPVWAHLAAAVQVEDHWGDFISFRRWGPGTGRASWQESRAFGGEPVRVSRILRDGDVIEHAGRRLDVHHCPGHERGLIVLFEAERRLAFVGDLCQGGMDCSANWLGLIEDPVRQRKSLAHLAELRPAWQFRGHREPHAGEDVQTDIAAAIGRVDAIEAAIVHALQTRSPLSDAQAARAAMNDVLHMDPPELPNFTVVTASAFLTHLALQGRAWRNADLAWEPIG